MILKRKANNVYAFKDEEELKEFCADNKSESVSMYSDFQVQKYNKKANKFDRISSNKIK
jgi:hypothetical protein